MHIERLLIAPLHISMYGSIQHGWIPYSYVLICSCFQNTENGKNCLVFGFSYFCAVCPDIVVSNHTKKIISNKFFSQLFVCLSRKIQSHKTIWSFPIIQIKFLYMVDGSLYIQALITSKFWNKITIYSSGDLKAQKFEAIDYICFSKNCLSKKWNCCCVRKFPDMNPSVERYLRSRL